MKAISSLYCRTKDFFNRDYDSKEYIELESQGFEDYMIGLQSENELLKEKVKEQDKMLFSITQENAQLSARVEELEQENEKVIDILNDSSQQQEIDERINNDIDYYGTKELDKNQYFDMLEKVIEDRNIYKDVIKIMCDKYNIDAYEVLNIVDDLKISQNKGQEKQLV